MQPFIYLLMMVPKQQSSPADIYFAMLKPQT
jgi:hypothetical protein